MMTSLRLSDGRNARRTMAPWQRRAFLQWMKSEHLSLAPALCEDA